MIKIIEAFQMCFKSIEIFDKLRAINRLKAIDGKTLVLAPVIQIRNSIVLVGLALRMNLKAAHSSVFRDQGVGGSNPLSPTNLFNDLQLTSGMPPSAVWAILRL